MEYKFNVGILEADKVISYVAQFNDKEDAIMFAGIVKARETTNRFVLVSEYGMGKVVYIAQCVKS